jgi:hypothetical protein
VEVGSPHEAAQAFHPMLRSKVRTRHVHTRCHFAHAHTHIPWPSTYTLLPLTLPAVAISDALGPLVAGPGPLRVCTGALRYWRQAPCSASSQAVHS